MNALVAAIAQALRKGKEAHWEFTYKGERWIMSLRPIGDDE